jgi:cell division protein ZapA
MKDETISINIGIGNRTYPLKIDASEEENVRSAAKLINEKEKFYRDHVSMKDFQDSLAMTSLELATALKMMQNKESVDSKSLNERLEKLDLRLKNSI